MRGGCGLKARGRSPSFLRVPPRESRLIGVGMPETHYARSGDVMVAYQVVGEGPFDVVIAPGLGVQEVGRRSPTRALWPALCQPMQLA
jgi:hypothetical protein